MLIDVETKQEERKQESQVEKVRSFIKSICVIKMN